MQVRATELIVDEGRIFAQPGRVGDVLDAESYDDGVRAVMVVSPNAPSVTTCFLGQNVEPLLALVSPAVDLVEPAPEPTRVQSARLAWPPRRTFAVGFAAGTAALVALLVWRACPPPEEAQKAVVLPPMPHVATAPVLMDVGPDEWARLNVGGSDSGWPPVQPGQQKARSKAPHCIPPFAVVVNGYCWLSLEQRPPQCPGGSVAYEGKCIVPLVEKARPDTSIRRE